MGFIIAFLETEKPQNFTIYMANIILIQKYWILDTKRQPKNQLSYQQLNLKSHNI